MTHVAILNIFIYIGILIFSIMFLFIVDHFFFLFIYTMVSGLFNYIHA
jgi:hypothetical protein